MIIASPAMATTLSPETHRHLHRHALKTHAESTVPSTATAQVAPAPEPSSGLFYHEDQGDEDGLSRKRSDCNKGCIDGPY